MSDVRGNFQVDEYVTETSNTVFGAAPRITGSMTNLTVKTGGALFQVGDVFDVESASGKQGKARVTEISNQTGKVTFSFANSFADGGWGFTSATSTADALAIGGTIKSIPSAPVVSVTNNCDGTSVLSTTATGTLLWSTGESSSSITVSTAGNYSVAQTVDGITSAATTATASPITVTNPTASNQSFCSLTTPTVANLTANGVNVKWYNAADVS